jgi:hypothetical protein
MQQAAPLVVTDGSTLTPALSASFPIVKSLLRM